MCTKIETRKLAELQAKNYKDFDGYTQENGRVFKTPFLMCGNKEGQSSIAFAKNPNQKSKERFKREATEWNIAALCLQKVQDYFSFH